MVTLRVAWAVAARDMAAELRRPTALCAVLLFGIAATVALHLAVAGSGRPSAGVVAGSLWVVLAFAAVLGSGRVVAAERESGSWDALLLMRADHSAIFIGKVLGSAGLIMIQHALLVPVFLAAFGAPSAGGGLALLAASVVLADIGLAAGGVLVGVLSLHARGRDLLGPAIQLPLALPLLLAAVALSLIAWSVPGAGGHAPQLAGFLVLYDLTFLAIGWAAVPEIVVE